MARKRRMCPPGIPVHIIQRGNNRQPCFFTDRDRAAYASWLGEAAEKYEVAIHAWVFMNNHVHLLATPGVGGGVSLMMQSLGRRYVRYFNREYERTGTLWEGRFKSSLIDTDEYFLTCQRYIELNPVRAGMVAHPQDYHWSSYQAHALGGNVAFWQPHPLYLALHRDPDTRRARYSEWVGRGSE